MTRECEMVEERVGRKWYDCTPCRQCGNRADSGVLVDEHGVCWDCFRHPPGTPWRGGSKPKGTELYVMDAAHLAYVQSLEDDDMNLAIDRQKFVDSIRELLQVIEMLMPGIGHIPVKDYALVNEAPGRAKKLIDV